MMKKKGNILTGNTLSLIIGAAIVVVLVLLFFKIMAPNWNRGEETAKSYWKQINEKLVEANEGKLAEMELLPVSKQGVAIYLIYFNNEYGMTIDSHTFFNPEGTNYHLSVCYSEKNSNSGCLAVPSELPSVLENGPAKWAIGEGTSFNIKLEGDRYVFRKI